MIYSKSQIPEHLHNYFRPAEYGLESSPAEYVETMRAVFAEVRRVLTDDGTLWLNLGDSYAAARGQGNLGGNLEGGPRPSFREDHASASASRLRIRYDRPNKSLLGIPWRVAFALQDDGWILRNDIIWAKRNAMPESVTDRLSTRHEYLFLFSKSRRYWFDLDPIREAHADASVKRAAPHRAAPGKAAREGIPYQGLAPGQTLRQDQMTHAKGRNPGDVWIIPTNPFPGAHFAVFPPELAERCVKAGCKPGGTVLDPFSGSGTTGMVAGRQGRRYVGIDLSVDYLDLSLRTRLAQSALIDMEVTA